MSYVQLQQAREKVQPSTSVPENKKSALNGDKSVASKPTTKPPKGIMGLFSNKSTSKDQDSSKDVKPEQKDVPPVVWLLSQSDKQTVRRAVEESLQIFMVLFCFSDGSS